MIRKWGTSKIYRILLWINSKRQQKEVREKLVMFTENQRNSLRIMSTGSTIYTTKCAINYKKCTQRFLTKPNL